MVKKHSSRHTTQSFDTEKPALNLKAASSIVPKLSLHSIPKNVEDFENLPA